jgi:hypothetical protein
MSAPTATRALPLLLLLAGCNLTLGIEDKRYQRGHCEDTTGKLRPIPESTDHAEARAVQDAVRAAA